MGAFLLGLVLGGNLVWVFMSLRRDGCWREFNARRRGSNPPPPGRKPAPPDWRRSFTHECINPPTGEPPLKLRKREPAPSTEPLIYGWGPGQLNPPPPAPGMRREWLWSPSQMAECGGPCWEAHEIARQLRQRHGGSSQVADWLDGVGCHA